jgi:hypothetical protein
LRVVRSGQNLKPGKSNGSARPGIRRDINRRDPRMRIGAQENPERPGLATGTFSVLH